MTIELRAKDFVNKKLIELTNRCNILKSKGIAPHLKVILVGNDPASLIYTKNKKTLCEKIGATCEIILLPEKIREEEFLSTIDRFNFDNSVHGIIIQLPLPGHLKTLNINSLVHVKKDVDGFHPENFFSILSGKITNKTLLPCTPKGIISLLNFYNIALEGKNVCVVGRSLIVGKPMSLLLNFYNATVTMAHSHTKNLKELTKNSDIVITAVGKPEFFSKEFFLSNHSQVVIDVGQNKNKLGEWVGDVKYNEVYPNVNAITPVPGGVGPLTVISLVENLLIASENV